MADLTSVAQQTLARADSAGSAAYDKVLSKTNDARLATEQMAHVITEHIKAGGMLSTLAGTGVSLIADLLAIFVTQITDLKQKGSPGLNDLIAATLSDALQIELTANDVPIASGHNQPEIAAALGGKFLASMKKFFQAEPGKVDGDSAEQGAGALLGLAMQMSVNTGFLALLGGMVPVGHFDEVKEVGEQLERSLGLGRLVRQALMPLIHNAVARPLERKYAAQFQQDILGAPQVATALLAGRFDAARGRQLLHEHGLSDEMIGELLTQHAPKLHPEETELLQAIEQSPQGDDFHAISSDGTSPEVAKARLAALTYRRKGSVRGHILSTVLSQISDGFLSPGDLDPVLQRLGVPADEQELWRILAGYSGERTRKRLSHGDMLFLYEAAQVTLEDVREWAKAEGYSDDDTDRLLLVFTLRAAGAHAGKAGGAAAKAAHAHNEHVAYVTDNITGIFGRPPSKAELDFWVNALDQGDRTKQDFRTEIKALSADGTAMPPQ